MNKQSSHSANEYSLLTSERVHKVGGWFVLAFWAAGMLCMCTMLLRAGYSKPEDDLTAASFSPARPASAGDAQSLASAGIQPVLSDDVIVFQSAESFIDYFGHQYSADELQAALHSVLHQQNQSTFKSIRVSANGLIRGVSFSQDYTLTLR